MAVPKRKHSKGRVRRKRNEKMTREVISFVKTSDGKGIKRPHVDEYIEL
jgi:ribosomal protein L32